MNLFQTDIWKGNLGVIGIKKCMRCKTEVYNPNVPKGVGSILFIPKCELCKNIR